MAQERLELSGAVFLFRPLPGQRSRSRLLFEARQIERLAVLAAIDLDFRSEFLLHFVAEKKPPLQMTGAELTFGILLVAGAHAWNSAFDFGAVA